MAIRASLLHICSLMGVIWLVEELTTAVLPAVPPKRAGAQVSRTFGPGKDADADSQSLAAAAAWVGWQNPVPLPGAR